MKRKLTSKILAFTMLIACVVACCFSLTACENKKPKPFDNTYVPPVYNTSGEEKNAVVILPGILGSNLVNAETGVSVWSGGGLMNNLFMSTTATDKEGRFKTEEIKKYLKSFLYKDENGKSVIPLRAATMNDKSLEYGLIDEYKNLYKFFKKTLGSTYDVVVYQYNWTNSCTQSAEELEQFITKNKYTNTILVGHSLGGTVIDYYLARSEQNRTNTKQVITLSTPHFGAVDAALLSISDIDINLPEKAVNALNKLITGKETNSEDLNGLLAAKPIFEEILGVFGLSLTDANGLLGNVDLGGINFINKLPKEYASNPLGFASDILNTALSYLRTMPSVYELLPSRLAFEKGFKGAKPVTINSNEVTYDEFIAEIKNLEYVKNNAYITKIVDGLSEKQDSLIIGGKFVTELVDTHYITANGYLDTLTTYSVNLLKEDGKLIVKPNTTNIKRVKSTVTETENNFGDGMVLVESAIAGCTNTRKIHVLKSNFDHIDIYSPESLKDGVHFLPIFVENELGETLKNIVKY